MRPNDTDIPEDDRGFDLDDVFTPGKQDANRRSLEFGEAPRKTAVPNSRPTSPMDSVSVDIEDMVTAGILDGNLERGDKSDFVETAREIGFERGNMETARGAMYFKLNEIISESSQPTSDGVQEGVQMISVSKDFAKMHIESIGIGAEFDSEFTCQSRLSNTISPSEFLVNAEKTAKDLLQFLDGEMDAKVPEPIVFMSLIPDMAEILSCTYKKCHFIVTRMEPNGNFISAVINGHGVWKRCDQMTQLVEKVAGHLGDGGSSTGDARNWWGHRRQYNEEVITLVTRTMPDAMDITLPLLSRRMTANLSQFKGVGGLLLPKEPTMKAYLEHAVSCWHNLGVRYVNFIKQIG